MNNSNVTPDEWEAQLIDYTLGVMEPAEAAAFEQGLEECRRHVRFAGEYEAVSGLLGAAVPAAEPPEGHKTRLMSRLQATPQVQAPAGTVSKSGASPQADGPALTIVPPITEGTTPENVTNLEAHRLRRTNNRLRTALAAAAGVILLLGLWGWTAYSDKLSAQNIPNVPAGYTLLPLPPQKGYEGVNAFALYNPDTNFVVFYGTALPQLAANQVYELWFLKKSGTPDPAGVFLPDAAGKALKNATGAQTMADYSGFAVTVEPSPGVTAPTGNPVVAGTYAAP